MRVPAAVGSSAGIAAPSVAAGEPAWLASLLASPVYAAQRALAGRTALSDDAMRTLLLALAERHGRAPRAVLASVLRQPELRMRGLLAAARRVLNVEGFAVLEEEEGTGAATLNQSLLLRQFGLAD